MDGVLHVSGDPIQGAAAAVQRLRADGHRLRFVTNTTTRSRAGLARELRNQGIELDDYPHLKAWFENIAERPAVQRGVKVMAELRRPITGDKEREFLFGKTQYERR